MRITLWAATAALGTLSSTVQADNKEVRYAPEASWVASVPAPTLAETPPGAAVRVGYFDNQVLLGSRGMEVYQAFRIRILKPEALQVGNLSITWNPAAGGATVHHLRIIRDGHVIDVLLHAQFSVIQREGFLENAMLNGDLTATLQVPDLQVGDELEFATTVQSKDPTLGDRLFGFVQVTQSGMPGDFRARVLWPKVSGVRWRTSPDVTNLEPIAVNDNMELVYELRDPHPALIADGAPDRVNLRRFIEMSDFESWAELSKRIWALFDKASVLKKGSPILNEVARIKAANPDPLVRLKIALQLVQDRIRYVYVGFNGGNYMPASADETWERKFGDCKAKTALLLAVLKHLDQPAEAVLVDVKGGDGLDDHLPSPLAFNHVMVRATVNKTVFWLDGTRQGDARLTSDPPGPYRWVLPLRSVKGDLERVPLKAATEPLELTYIYADASQGFDERAQVEMQRVTRGDEAVQMRAALSVMSSEDAERALLSYWRKGNSWLEPSAASWHYDESRGTMLLTVKGAGKLDWEGDSTNGRKLDVFGAGFYKPDELHRPAEQDQRAPWKLNFPQFQCWATAIRLPPGDQHWKWDYSSDPINVHVGGVHYYRAADLREGLIRTVMSTNTEVPELTADDAEKLNKDIPSFNHYMSSVYQIGGGTTEKIENPFTRSPFPLDIDWTRPDVPCGQ
jgi:hypothetical protein